MGVEQHVAARGGDAGVGMQFDRGGGARRQVAGKAGGAPQGQVGVFVDRHVPRGANGDHIEVADDGRGAEIEIAAARQQVAGEGGIGRRCAVCGAAIDREGRASGDVKRHGAAARVREHPVHGAAAGADLKRAADVHRHVFGTADVAQVERGARVHRGRAGDTSQAVCVGDGELAGADGGGTVVGVGASQHQRAGAALGQVVGIRIVGDDTAEGDGITAIDVDRARAGQRGAARAEVGRCAEAQGAHTKNETSGRQRIGMGDVQGAGVDVGTTAVVGVGAGKCEGAGAGLNQVAAVAAHDAGERELGAVDVDGAAADEVDGAGQAAGAGAGSQRSVVVEGDGFGAHGDVLQVERGAAGDGGAGGGVAERVGVGDGQRAGGDGGGAVVGVGAGERERAGAQFLDRAAAGNKVADGEGIAAIENQRGIVGDTAAAERADQQSPADLQRAGADGGDAGVGVGAGEVDKAGAGLGQAACTADDAGIATKRTAADVEGGGAGSADVAGAADAAAGIEDEIEGAGAVADGGVEIDVADGVERQRARAGGGAGSDGAGNGDVAGLRSRAAGGDGDAGAGIEAVLDGGVEHLGRRGRWRVGIGAAAVERAARGG